MRAAGDLVGSYQPLDLGPNPDVRDALTAFQDESSTAVATIRANLDTLQNLLAQAAAGYRATDSQAAQAFRDNMAPARRAGAPSAAVQAAAKAAGGPAAMIASAGGGPSPSSSSGGA